MSRASFRVLSLGNTATNAVQLVNKLVMAAILYLGAKLVIDAEPDASASSSPST